MIPIYGHIGQTCDGIFVICRVCTHIDHFIFDKLFPETLKLVSQIEHLYLLILYFFSIIYVRAFERKM